MRSIIRSLQRARRAEFFGFEGVPPGPRTVQYWHEFLGTGEKRIMVPREGISRVRLTIPLPVKLRLAMKKCAGP